MIVRAIVRRKKTAAAAVILSAVAVVGAVFALRPLGEELLARHYMRRIDETSDSREAEALMRQAADLGEPGLRVLVAGLGSSRESVARAAGKVIAQRLEAWRSLRTRYSTPLLARLAHELADAAEGFDADAREDAGRFALQILDCRLDRYAVDRCGVIGACQKVIRAAEADADSQHRIAGDRPETQLPADDIQARTDARLHAGGTVGSLPIARLAALAGGGLPKSVDPIPLDETLEDKMERRAAIAAIVDRQTREPDSVEQDTSARWFNAPTVPRPVISNRGAPGLFRPTNVAARLSRKGAPVNKTPPVKKEASINKGTSFDNGPVATRSELSRVKTADLLRRLESAHGPTAAAAKNELLCRGFKDHHFRIVARLFDPDPAARMALARQLQSIPRLNPRPWLFYLAGDTDSDVRLTAITLLATVADPAILGEVESLARRDPDARIQLQAQKIAERRVQR